MPFEGAGTTGYDSGTPRTPEQQVIGITSHLNQLVSSSFSDPNVIGGRINACNFVPFLVETLARQSTPPLTADVYQLMDVRQAVTHEVNNSFKHGFTIVSAGTVHFLVDLTFCQYMHEDGQIGESYVNRNGVKNTNPLAQNLFNNGYVLLTDDNFREYLRITSLDTTRDIELIRTATIDKFNHVKPHPPEFTDGEIRNLLAGREHYDNGSTNT